VYNYIYDSDGGRLDSVLMFPRSPIVRSIRVICDYTVSSCIYICMYTVIHLVQYLQIKTIALLHQCIDSVLSL
jgi:hypothetical protein